MTNDEEIAKIKTMSERQLLDYVMDDPTMLTDPYYADLRRAAVARYDELIAARGVSP